MKETTSFIDIGNEYLERAKFFRENCSAERFGSQEAVIHYTSLCDKAKFFHFLAFKTLKNTEEE